MLEHNLKATQPLAGYIGGKRRLAKHISERISQIDHKAYIEPFVGMGGVFLRKNTKAPCEVINDISGEVINLFRIIQRHPEALFHAMRFKLASREDFEAQKITPTKGLTDIERAARFLFLQRLAFSGKVTGQNFGVAIRSSPMNVTKLQAQIAPIHERLASVIIEREPYQKCIERYDRETSLFYIDPPYWDAENCYGDGVFTKEDFQHLADQLGKIKGRFLLSINDAPQIREIFNRFEFEEVQTTYSSYKTQRNVPELIISN